MKEAKSWTLEKGLLRDVFHADTFFLARAMAAMKWKMDPMSIRLAGSPLRR